MTKEQYKMIEYIINQYNTEPHMAKAIIRDLKKVFGLKPKKRGKK